MNKINQQSIWWTLSYQRIAELLNTDLNNGLSIQEANNRLKKFGLNKLPKKREFTLATIFLRQLINTFVLVLLVSLTVASLMGQFIDAVAIGAILILNAFIGFIQEYSAERSLQALQKMVSPKARIIRDGTEQIIMAQELVPGDLVIIQPGDIVPADGRIIKQNNLAAQEAALTGESVTVSKTTETLNESNLSIGERINMVFMGTSIVRGNGTFIITETGAKTQLGIIATLIKKEKETTHLEIKIRQLTRLLVIICLFIIALILLIYAWRSIPFSESILAALSLAVAAIPEGLPSVIIVALSIGVQRMVRAHTIVRRLSAIETIGAVTVICSDKTGTLTKNEMMATKIWIADRIIDVNSSFFYQEKEIDINQFPGLIQLLKICSLCNSASITHKNNEWVATGDPTEVALLTVSIKAGFNRNELAQEFPLLKEMPFDSESKRASSLRQYNNKQILFTQGAPEVILNLSTKILVDNKIVQLTPEYKNKIHAILNQFAHNALRVIGTAFKYIDFDNNLEKISEDDFIFVGLVGLIDPPRDEARDAIKECKKAGIRVIMITGDYSDTAIAIAKQLELDNELNVIAGHELQKLSDAQFKKEVKHFSIYSRISPEQKIRIVQAWQSQGAIVAMTGDGVNDAPAIKIADIGIAMGITGTDVTKQAADIIITDDNFASIAQAVKFGRGILDNIIKFIQYLLSHNIIELLIILLAVAIGFTEPTGKTYVALLPIQLLWLNLVTDGIMAIALAFDPISPDIMNRPPRDPQKPLISWHNLFHFFIIGIIYAFGILIISYISLQRSVQAAHTVTLTALIIIALNLIYFVRSYYNLPFLSNKWIILAFIISLCMQMLIMYIPILQYTFKVVPLQLYEWISIVITALLLWPLLILMKKLFRRD